MEKYRIARGSIQETLLVPLYCRALCTRRFPSVFSDRKAVGILDMIDYDFSSLDAVSRRRINAFGALEVAMRQKDIEHEVRGYLETHPRAAVVNLGCGLDDTGRRCDNGKCRMFNIDLPDVIALRDRLLPAGEREVNVAFDIRDVAWFDLLDRFRECGAIIFASGVFYYLGRSEVRRLCEEMSERFAGGVLVFDAVGPAAMRWMTAFRTGRRDSFFSVRDAKKEIGSWSERLSVSSRGLMQGYERLEGPGIGPCFRLFSAIADGPAHLCIVRIEFLE